MMSDCVVEKLCQLVDDPDDNDVLEAILPYHEGQYDADDVSVIYNFKCAAIGCAALTACSQWYKEETDESGSTVYIISGECKSGNATYLPKKSQPGS